MLIHHCDRLTGIGVLWLRRTSRSLELDEVDTVSLHKSQLLLSDSVEDVSSSIFESRHALCLDNILDRNDGTFNGQLFEGNHVRLVVHLGFHLDDTFAFDFLSIGQYTSHRILCFLRLKVGKILGAVRSVAYGA